MASQPKHKDESVGTSEKVLVILVFFGSIILISNGYREYRQIMLTPQMVKGCVVHKELSSSPNHYSWDVMYEYYVDSLKHRAFLKDNSPVSIDYKVGDTLFVYYNELSPGKSLALKTPADVKIKPEFTHFIKRDSHAGYLAYLLIVILAIKLLPVLIKFIFNTTLGFILLPFNNNVAASKFVFAFSSLKEGTIAKLQRYFSRW